MGKYSIFVHDEAPPYTSRAITDFLDGKELRKKRDEQNMLKKKELEQSKKHRTI